jgi:hypothetical protein
MERHAIFTGVQIMYFHNEQLFMYLIL